MNNNQQESKLSISIPTVIQVIFLILGIGFLFAIREVLAILFFGLIVASAIDPLANFLEDRGMPRVLAVLGIFLGTIALAAFIFWLIIPPLFLEIRELALNFPQYSKDFIVNIERFGFVPPGFFAQNIGQILAELSLRLGGIAGGIQQVAKGVIGITVALISIFLISFYLSLRRDGVEQFLKLIVPKNAEPYIIDLWQRAQKKLGYWFRGQLILMFIIGVFSFAGLSLVGVRFSLLLAILAAVLEIVPIAGPIVAGAAAVLAALLESWLIAIVVVVIYIVIQQAESNVIVPLVFKKVLGLHPVVVIAALLIGGKLGGIPGLILAVPIVAVLTEFLSDVAKGRVKL